MTFSTLLLLLLLSAGRSDDRGPAALDRAPAATQELVPPRDAGRDPFGRETSEGNLDEEEDVEDETLPGSPCGVPDGSRRPAALTDLDDPSFPPCPENRRRPLRGPPAP